MGKLTFNYFREKHLLKEKLNQKDLTMIFNRYVKPLSSISCAEYHAHSYLRGCYYYKTEEAEIIDRLRIEVLNLLEDKGE